MQSIRIVKALSKANTDFPIAYYTGTDWPAEMEIVLLPKYSSNPLDSVFSHLCGTILSLK